MVERDVTSTCAIQVIFAAVTRDIGLGRHSLDAH